LHPCIFEKMAEKTNTENGSNEGLEKVQSYFKQNRKSLTIIGVALVVMVGGYYSYNKFYKEKNEKKAADSIWKAEYFFEKDSFNLAINGRTDASGSYLGFKKIAEKYSGTTAGNVASYCLGICYLNTGKYKEAVEALEETSFDDDFVSCVAIGAQGDAYREMNKIDEAIDKYEDAANRVINDFTTPIYLKKAAIAYEEKKNYKKAAELYQRIYDEFEHTNEGRDAEKYLEHAKNLSGK